MKEDDYDSLEELIEDMEEIDTNSPEYSILKGLVYDTLRYEEDEVPPEVAGDIVTLLSSDDFEEARENLGEYLEPEDVDIE